MQTKTKNAEIETGGLPGISNDSMLDGAIQEKIAFGQAHINTNADLRIFGYVAVKNKVSKKIVWRLKSDIDKCNAITDPKRKGYRGGYKGKNFYYKNKISEGYVRHHIFYDDSDPNKGIYLMTIAGHSKFHHDLKKNIMIDITAYKNLKVGEEI